jgi:phosphoglycerate dehydrogenase-like enzyme
MRIVIYPPIDSARLEKVVSAAGSCEVINAGDETSALAAMGAADGMIGKITPPLLSAARRLRWVQSMTASLEHYLFPELIAHPCTLTNMRGLFSDVVADHVLGYIICLARNFPRYIRSQLAGRWAPVGGESERSTLAAGPGVTSAIDRAHQHLADMTLGIVGLGSIGAEVARRGLAFGMRVIAVDPVQTAGPPGVEAVWPLSRLPDLLVSSDYAVIAAPHTPQTQGLFGRGQFALMKPSAFLINVGRGAIVKLDELVEALATRRIAGAALDVFETEPLPPGHPLWRMENVIITPHVAGASPRIAERHLAVLLDNVRRFVRGEPLHNVVDKTRWF